MMRASERGKKHSQWGCIYTLALMYVKILLFYSNSPEDQFTLRIFLNLTPHMMGLALIRLYVYKYMNFN